LVIEVRSGFNPEAVLSELYRLTPMEETFGINNVALVDGQPRVLGLRELLSIYVDHRIEVVRRRSEFRRRKREDRLHLVDGLMIALLDIDEVIGVIRSSDDSAAAKQRLMSVFDLSEIQAQYILDTPLRRLTRFDRIELEREREQLRREIDELTEILSSDERLRDVVSSELADMAKRFGTPRRTVLLEGSGAALTAAVPLEVADEPCTVLLSSTGLLARTAPGAPPEEGGSDGSEGRAAHDVVVSAAPSTVRGEVGVVTSAGRMIKLSVLEFPALPATVSAFGLSGGTPVSEFTELDKGETVVALASLDTPQAGLALGTASGVVKRVQPDYPQNRDEFEIITLKDTDRVVGAVQLTSEDQDLVFISSDAQLLHFPASAVRPQGRSAGGMAGIRLAARASVIWFGAVALAATEGAEATGALVVTVAGTDGALPGTGTGSVKVSDWDEFPVKGRATGGVRCHRFLKGEDALTLAWAGAAPALGATEAGVPVELPGELGRRDGSGIPLPEPLAALGGTPAAAGADAAVTAGEAGPSRAG
ncbi:MAG TPA: DNA gyrase subunit A, partial [Streptosporangiaceae bacterium]|nr:DNA gyrase subunit A [Streptosporangiaceae bacterium]